MRKMLLLLGVLAITGWSACGDDTDKRTDDDDDGGSGGSVTTTGSGGGAGVGGSGVGGSGAATGVGGGGGQTMATNASSSASSGAGGAPPSGCGPDGVALINAINQYRMNNGLGAIPASSSLCIVAEHHVNDLRDNAPHAPANCNLHSWSDQGPWSACCYTPDHAQAQCMWDKPSELTNYTSNGFEISASGTNDPMSAVQLWSGSSGHNAVILNQGSWANLTWGAIGAAQHDGYAHVWFGTATDPG